MSYLPEILTVFVVHLLAVIAPGPDFIMITRNSFVYSRRSGVYSALGLSLGMLVHMAYTIVGIGVLISQSIILFSIIKYLGAAYLIYLGYGALKAKSVKGALENQLKGLNHSRKDLSPWTAVRMGFLTNALNPKATLFFLSLFTQVVDPAAPAAIYLIYALVIFMNGFGWFSLLALVLSHHRVQKLFGKFGHYIERILGGMLILLGLKVATAANE